MIPQVLGALAWEVSMSDGVWNLLRSFGIGRPAFFRARRFDSGLGFRQFFSFFFGSLLNVLALISGANKTKIKEIIDLPWHTS